MNPYGNWGENYVTQSTDASVDSSTGWTIFNKEKKPLTFVTECWWCSERVYFYRDEFGGCVLFDELGHPWPIHECWLTRSDRSRRAVVPRIKSILVGLNYDGNYYYSKRKAIRKPIKGQLDVSVSSYVSDNRIFYKTRNKEYIKAVRCASSLIHGEIRVMLNDTKEFPFLLPFAIAKEVKDFEIGEFVGRWVERKSKWYLFASKIKIIKNNGAQYREYEISSNLFSGEINCYYCNSVIGNSIYWGIDPNGDVECDSCSKMRGSLSRLDFIEKCKVITTHAQTRKTVAQ